MSSGKVVTLTNAQVSYISKNYEKKKMRMSDFLKKKVLALPDGKE
jgi:hypothetical protein